MESYDMDSDYDVEFLEAVDAAVERALAAEASRGDAEEVVVLSEDEFEGIPITQLLEEVGVGRERPRSSSSVVDVEVAKSLSQKEDDDDDDDDDDFLIGDVGLLSPALPAGVPGPSGICRAAKRPPTTSEEDFSSEEDETPRRKRRKKNATFELDDGFTAAGRIYLEWLNMKLTAKRTVATQTEPEKVVPSKKKKKKKKISRR